MRFGLANVAAQFQDIGVTAQMGMNPMIIALQQGTQLSAVLNSQATNTREVFSLLGGALLSVLNPISLITIGVVGLTAATIQWGMAALNSEKDIQAELKEHEKWLKTITEGYDEAGEAAARVVEAARQLPQGVVEIDLQANIAEQEKAISDFDNTMASMIQRLEDYNAQLEQNARVSEQVGHADDGTIAAMQAQLEILRDLGITSESTTAEIAAAQEQVREFQRTAGEPGIRNIAEQVFSLLERLRLLKVEAEASGAALRTLQSSSMDLSIGQGLERATDALEDLRGLTPDLRDDFEKIDDALQAVRDAAEGLPTALGEPMIQAAEAAAAHARATLEQAEAMKVAEAAARRYNNVLDSLNEKAADNAWEQATKGMDSFSKQVLDLARDAGLVEEAIALAKATAGGAWPIGGVVGLIQKFLELANAARRAAAEMENARFSSTTHRVPKAGGGFTDVTVTVPNNTGSSSGSSASSGSSSGSGGGFTSQVINGVTVTTPNRAQGGILRGPGSGTSDDILARVSNGEYIVNARATEQHLPLLEAINRGDIDVPRFRLGGPTTTSTRIPYDPTDMLGRMDPRDAPDWDGSGSGQVGGLLGWLFPWLFGNRPSPGGGSPSPATPTLDNIVRTQGAMTWSNAGGRPPDENEEKFAAKNIQELIRLIEQGKTLDQITGITTTGTTRDHTTETTSFRFGDGSSRGGGGGGSSGGGPTINGVPTTFEEWRAQRGLTDQLANMGNWSGPGFTNIDSNMELWLREYYSELDEFRMPPGVIGSSEEMAAALAWANRHGLDFNDSILFGGSMPNYTPFGRDGGIVQDGTIHRTLPSFAQGGAILPGADREVVSFRSSPDELIGVFTPTQRRQIGEAMSGGEAVVINQNIRVNATLLPDQRLNSRSRAEIRAMMAESVRQASFPRD